MKFVFVDVSLVLFSEYDFSSAMDCYLSAGRIRIRIESNRDAVSICVVTADVASTACGRFARQALPVRFAMRSLRRYRRSISRAKVSHGSISGLRAS
jgi:hypothetical protein